MLDQWPAPFEFRDVNELFPKTASGEIAYDRETSLVDTWKAMIELKKSGKVKSIGVSK